MCSYIKPAIDREMSVFQPVEGNMHNRTLWFKEGMTEQGQAEGSFLFFNSKYFFLFIFLTVRLSDAQGVARYERIGAAAGILNVSAASFCKAQPLLRF